MLQIVSLPPLPLPQEPENRALPIEQLKALMRREKNKKMAAISRTKNVMHVCQLEDKVGEVALCTCASWRIWWVRWH